MQSERDSFETRYFQRCSEVPRSEELQSEVDRSAVVEARRSGAVEPLQQRCQPEVLARDPQGEAPLLPGPHPHRRSMPTGRQSPKTDAFLLSPPLSLAAEPEEGVHWA